jgi:hypothetical protein
MKSIARLFRYTTDLEAQLETARRVEEMHHCEIDALHELSEQLRSDLQRQSDLRAAAEAISQLKDAELERQRRWIHKLSDQNLALMDRICLQNRTVPVSEPLTKVAADSPNGEDVAKTVTRMLRTGPVAKARQDAEAEYRAELAKEEEARAKAGRSAAAAAARASSDPPDQLASDVVMVLPTGF